jgi:hypothetical protein
MGYTASCSIYDFKNVTRCAAGRRARIISRQIVAAESQPVCHTPQQSPDASRRSVIFSVVAFASLVSKSCTAPDASAAGAPTAITMHDYNSCSKFCRILQRCLIQRCMLLYETQINFSFAEFGSLARFLQSKQEKYALAPIGVGKRKLSEAATLLSEANTAESRASALKIIRSSSFNCYVYEVSQRAL